MQHFGLEGKAAATPQNKKIPGRNEMVKNNAGGFTFKMDKWKRLEKFLVIGTEGGTYYAGEAKLDKQNTTNLLKCIAEDGIRTVNTIVTISDEGRAIRNAPAVFALAICASSSDTAVKKHALANMHKVCRIGTDLFHFVEYCESIRGWGRLLRKAVADWYTEKSDDTLALQLLKYKQRDGWSHKDLLRLSHAKPKTELQNSLFKTVVGKSEVWPNSIPICQGVNLLGMAKDVGNAAILVKNFRLPREVIPTEMLNEITMWEALLPSMPLTALIRNLGKMASLRMLSNTSPNTDIVCQKLANIDNIRKSRLHPMAIYIALKMYRQGKNNAGAQHGREMQWSPCPRITDALNDAFYMAFSTIEPSGKVTMCALDVSGSMSGYQISGSNLISCREAAAIMAMVTARTESKWMITGFTANGSNVFRNGERGRYGRSGIAELNISPRQRLTDICTYVGGLGFEATDCALPMLYAIANNLYIDTFVIYTDNETWFGDVHPAQALREYRNKINPSAKLAVVSMTSNEFSIADPEDSGTMDVIGFDTVTPAVIADFSR